MKILLYSGGMDSYLIKKLWKPDCCLYVDIDSAYSGIEIANLPADIVTVGGCSLSEYERLDFIIPYRNAYLILQAANWLERQFPIERNTSAVHELVEICMGATAGDRVLDKSEPFADMMSELLTFLSSPQHWTGGLYRDYSIVLPFKNTTKRQLLQQFIAQGGDLEKAFRESFSCYEPIKLISPDPGKLYDYKPCWECKPCVRKAVAFALEGYQLPAKIKGKVQGAIERDILPQITAGTYGRGADEEADILAFMEL